jgi:hypothetical protein
LEASEEKERHGGPSSAFIDHGELGNSSMAAVTAEMRWGQRTLIRERITSQTCQ